MTTVIGGNTYTGEMKCVTPVQTLKVWLTNALKGMQVVSGSEQLDQVYVYTGTRKEDLFRELPHLKAPCAILWYAGSSWGNRPRRLVRFIVTILESNMGGLASIQDADARAVGYVEDFVDAVQREIIPSSNVEVRVVSDAPVAVEARIAAYELDVHFNNQ